MPVLRWLAAFALLYACFRAFKLALTLSGLGAAGPLILGFAALIGAVLLLSPEIVIPVCEWFSRLFTNIILPSDTFNKPVLSYNLARLYVRQMRYSESLDQYKMILRHYPEEREAYRELISFCGLMGETAVASRYQKSFQKMFPGEPLELLDPAENPSAGARAL